MSLLKTYNVSLEPEYNEKWVLLAKKNYTDKSKILRKWIDENWEQLKIAGGLIE